MLLHILDSHTHQGLNVYLKSRHVLKLCVKKNKKILLQREKKKNEQNVGEENREPDATDALYHFEERQ